MKGGREMENCLLQYNLLTEPDPIRISPPEGNRQLTRLTLVVSNSEEIPIYCKRIRLKLEIGDYAHNLTDVAEGIRVEIAPSKPNAWSFSYDEQGNFLFEAQTKRERNFLARGLTVTLSNIAVNRQAGTFDVILEEEASFELSGDYDWRSTTIPLSKFPGEPSIENFKATPDEVEHGGSTTLSWRAPENAGYLLSWDGSEPVDVTKVREWVVSGIETPTVFTLTSTAQLHGETEQVTRHVHVRVRRAEILDFFPVPNQISSWGEEVELRWRTNQLTDYCELIGGNGVLLSELKDHQGSYPVQSTQECHSFTLRAFYNGHAVEQTTYVPFVEQEAFIKATPSKAYPKQKIIISWECPTEMVCIFEDKQKFNFDFETVIVGEPGEETYWLRYQHPNSSFWKEKRIVVPVVPYEEFFRSRIYSIDNKAADGTIYTYKFHFKEETHQVIFEVTLSGSIDYTEDLIWQRDGMIFKLFSEKKEERIRLQITSDALVLLRIFAHEIPFATDKRQVNSVSTLGDVIT